jgi:hypothetical protein
MAHQNINAKPVLGPRPRKKSFAITTQRHAEVPYTARTDLLLLMMLLASCNPFSNIPVIRVQAFT